MSNFHKRNRLASPPSFLLSFLSSFLSSFLVYCFSWFVLLHLICILKFRFLNFFFPHIFVNLCQMYICTEHNKDVHHCIIYWHIIKSLEAWPSLSVLLTQLRWFREAQNERRLYIYNKTKYHKLVIGSIVLGGLLTIYIL